MKLKREKPVSGFSASTVLARYCLVSLAWLTLCWPVSADSLATNSALKSVTMSAATRAILINDSDGDRVVDTVDVDDDNDGITDVFEIASDGNDRDTDRDGVVDRLDLDSDNDGILDWQESGAVFTVDFSALRVVSGRLLGPVGENGFIDALETALDNGQMRYSLVNSDAPYDAFNDVLDLDSDNDGLPDLLEAGVDASFDNDNDARIDIDKGSGSVGLDGIPNRLQNTNDETCCDVNGDGVEDIVPRNTDGTDFPDFQDLDSDNDGVFDLVEAGGRDFDKDGRVDNFFDSPVLDGMDDTLLSIPLSAPDTNGNAVPDHLDEFAQATDDDSTGEGQTDSGQQQDPTGRDPSGQDPTTPITAPVDNGGNDGSDRDPAIRPGENILAEGPSEDDPSSGAVKTGINAAGCSVQSSGMDLILLVLSVLSITVLGWRYSVRRIRQK